MAFCRSDTMYLTAKTTWDDFGMNDRCQFVTLLLPPKKALSKMLLKNMDIITSWVTQLDAKKATFLFTRILLAQSVK